MFEIYRFIRLQYMYWGCMLPCALDELLMLIHVLVVQVIVPETLHT